MLKQAAHIWRNFHPFSMQEQQLDCFPFSSSRIARTYLWWSIRKEPTTSWNKQASNSSPPKIILRLGDFPAMYIFLFLLVPLFLPDILNSAFPEMKSSIASSVSMVFLSPRLHTWGGTNILDIFWTGFCLVFKLLFTAELTYDHWFQNLNWIYFRFFFSKISTILNMLKFIYQSFFYILILKGTLYPEFSG